MTNSANRTEAFLKEKDPRDEKGGNDAHIGPALPQKLNPEPTNHIPLRVVTVSSIFPESYQSDTGHKKVLRGAQLLLAKMSFG
jgi:hypothetical protein